MEAFALSELQWLGVAIVLGIFQLFWAAVASRRQQGLKWARGPRDEARPVSGMAARLNRAFANYMETFPFFAAAVLAAYVLGEQDVLTFWGAAIYVLARIVYVPLYAWGTPLRSLVWFVSILGLLTAVAGLFF